MFSTSTLALSIRLRRLLIQQVTLIIRSHLLPAIHRIISSPLYRHMGKTTIQVVDRTCGGNFESGKNSSDIGAPRKQRLPTQHGLINRVSSCRGRVAAARGDRCTPASAPTSPPNVTAPASVALISAPAHSASGETSASAPDAVPVNAPSVTEFGHASVPAPVGAASNGTQTPQGQPSSQGQASTQEQQSSLGSSSRRHSPASRGSPSSQRPPTSNAPFSPRVSPLSKGRRSNQKTSEGPQNPEQYKRNFDAREKGIRKYLVYDKGYVPSGSHSESKGSRAGPTGQAQTGSHTSPNVPSSGAIPYPPLEPPSQQPAAVGVLPPQSPTSSQNSRRIRPRPWRSAKSNASGSPRPPARPPLRHS